MRLLFAPIITISNNLLFKICYKNIVKNYKNSISLKLKCVI